MAPKNVSLRLFSLLALWMISADVLADTAAPADLVHMQHLYQRVRRSQRRHHDSRPSAGCPAGCNNWRRRYSCSPTITSHQLDSRTGASPNCVTVDLFSRATQKASFCFAELWMPSTAFHKLQQFQKEEISSAPGTVRLFGQGQRFVGEAKDVVLPSRQTDWLVIDLPDDSLFAEKKLDICIYNQDYNVAEPARTAVLRTRRRILASADNTTAFFVSGYSNQGSLEDLMVMSHYASDRQRRAAAMPTPRSDGGMTPNSSTLLRDNKSGERSLCSLTTAVEVSFQELGMHSVVAPLSILLRDCRGVCKDLYQLPRASKFALLKQQIREMRRTGRRLPAMSPSCCVPTMFNPLTVLAARVEAAEEDKSSSDGSKLFNRSLEMLTLEGLLPTTCGCT